MTKIGIDAISYYVPSIYVAISDLAECRQIEYAKLHKGLGLHRMAIPDADEDAASFAANALLKLIEENNLDPRTLGRIYLGTESSLDGAKPTSTYAVEAVEAALTTKYGERCLKNCDVLDMTFACIGAVDAMHNSLDWIKAGKGRKAIVIASDLAKYELGSTGEYTQGAGAVSLLLCENPSIVSISDTWGVASQSVGDFFKPRRKFDKLETFKNTAALLGTKLTSDEAQNLMEKDTSSFWSDGQADFEIFKEEPVFDGPYSNECYQDRISEALEHFKNQKPLNVLKDWHHLLFHLPYAYQGRRMIVANWVSWLKDNQSIQDLYDDIGQPASEQDSEWLRNVSKTTKYQEFITQKIERGERASSDIGNMYTASIFMALLSLLNSAYEDDSNISGNKIGFFSYGSGSKSKVFEGTIERNWKIKIKDSNLFEYLNKRKAISIEAYEQLHNGSQKSAIVKKDVVKLLSIENTSNLKGYRFYSL